MSRRIFFLKRANGADAQDPGDAQLFHGPEIGAMIQFTGKDAMAPAVAWKKDYVAPGEFAGEKIVRGRAKRSFDLDPFLVGEALDMIEPAAADDANFMFRHGLLLP